MPAARDRAIRRVLWVEGACNVAVLGAKTSVGLATGSAAVLGDAIHSLCDVANNGVALVAARVASTPPDREHPYGHRRFETLAVFLLATLLAVLAVEMALHAFGEKTQVLRQDWSLALMLGVLAANVGLSTWEGRQARLLDSDLLRADARHTASDVVITLGVIAGWQLAARGFPWLDTALALCISALILALSYGLFRRAVPILVDRSAADPDQIAAVIDAIPGVRSTRRVRSRAGDGGARVDVVVTVDPSLPTRDSHAIADAIESALRERFASEEVIVHIEPGAARREVS